MNARRPLATVCSKLSPESRGDRRHECQHRNMLRRTPRLDAGMTGRLTGVTWTHGVVDLAGHASPPERCACPEGRRAVHLAAHLVLQRQFMIAVGGGRGGGSGLLGPGVGGGVARSTI